MAIYYRTDEKRGYGIYDISLYNTVWNNLFHPSQQQTIILNLNAEEISTIYYVSNGQEHDMVIYGVNPNVNGGTLTLPRLVLNYYFAIAILVAIILAVFFLLFRKRKKRKGLL